MKRILWLALLAMVLPMAAFADNQVDFTNDNGTLTGSASGLTLTGSVLTVVNGFGGGGILTGSSLGSVSVSTGALTSGSLGSGGTFAAGGVFDIASNGQSGLPNGYIFQGTFSGPVTLTLLSVSKGVYYYAISGGISGTWYNGSTVSGVTNLTFSTKGAWTTGAATTLASGDTVITSTVPEPGTLGLLGTGFIGLAGVLHRKFRG